MAISYDTLELTIGANVDSASRGIKTLKNNLNALQKVVQSLDFKLLEDVEKHLQGIANIDFSNVSKGLQDVVNAFKSFTNKKFLDYKVKPTDNTKAQGLLTNFGGGWDNANFEPPLPTIDFDKTLIPQFQSVSGVVEHATQDFNGLRVSIDAVKSAMAQNEGYLEKLANGLKDVGLNGTQLQAIFDTIGGETDKFNDEQLQKVKKIMEELGFSAEQVAYTMSKLKKETNKASEQARKGASKWEKLVNAFKRVLFYRIVRKAIQMVGQAIKEGIQNMALFDSEFNQSMSAIKSSMTYLKNSFASLVAPIVELIAPILTMFSDLFAEINNELGKMFAMLSGKNSFAKATKGAEDYAESLKKAKSVSLGIDELNVAQKDENADNFVQESIDGESSGSLKNVLGEFIDKIRPLIEQFKTGLMPIIEAIMNVFNKLSPILNVVIDLFAQLIGETMDGVNKSITDFINMIASILGFVGTIMEGLKPILETIIHYVSTLINIFNESLSVLFEVVGDLLDVLSDILGSIMTILQPILKVISVVLNAINDFGKNLIDFFKNILQGLLSGMVNMLKVIAPILKIIANFFGGDLDEKSKGERIALGVLTLGGSEIMNAIGKAGSHAQGGFVEDGFFFANHNELVGQFSNGKTAVANNEQITTGIYNAVLQAMNDSAQGNGREIILQIDGREIGRASEKYEAQKGDKSLFMGGY